MALLLPPFPFSMKLELALKALPSHSFSIKRYINTRAATRLRTRAYSSCSPASLLASAAAAKFQLAATLQAVVGSNSDANCGTAFLDGATATSTICESGSVSAAVPCGKERAKVSGQPPIALTHGSILQPPLRLPVLLPRTIFASSHALNPVRSESGADACVSALSLNRAVAARTSAVDKPQGSDAALNKSRKNVASLTDIIFI